MAFKGGTNFPGRVALKLDKNILNILGENYKLILITGTNGKTTTTSMIYNMIQESGKDVITNNTGANMLPGIVSCLVENFSYKKQQSERYAVIEVDEANLKFITEHLTPYIITVTNLFRDQLDRFGEVYTTLNKILEGIEKVPSSTLVLNGDESLLGDLGLSNPTVYFGFNTALDNNKTIDLNADAKFCKKCKSPYKYHYISYNHLGNFYCTNCGYMRPPLNYSVDKVIEQSSEGSLVEIDNNEYYINQPGTYNIYNGVCAYSIAKLLNINNSVVFNSLKSQKSSFGRQESVTINNKNIKIILVKNPAGFDEAINTIALDKRKLSLAFILNDNYADGRDVSWIWDVAFEKLTALDVSSVMVAGIRRADMAVRLKVAGFNTDSFSLCENHEELLTSIINSENDTLYILATYTAMISFRKHLHSKGYINKLW
jgi:UDP-N-acetylmuramyl tripeptide synthase